MCKQPFIIGSQPLVLMRQLEVGIGALGQTDQASKAVVAQLTGAVMQRLYRRLRLLYRVRGQMP